MTLTHQEADQLRNNCENYSHNHPDDRVPTHDTLNQLQKLATSLVTSGDHIVTHEEDYIQCFVTCTVTLPSIKVGKEFEITVMIEGITVTIVPTGIDTVQGTDSVVTSIQWTSLRFKSILGGYILI